MFGCKCGRSTANAIEKDERQKKMEISHIWSIREAGQVMVHTILGEIQRSTATEVCDAA
jgi:hypothetical protein